MIINAYKPVGKTPLDVINKIKKDRPELGNRKIGYAGRLDPMAEGVLLLMVEPETKNRDKYQNLEKTYEFEILFGVETDSLDILGLITKTEITTVSEKKLNSAVKKLKGKIELPYPIYSSKTVKGKPLYWWARNNKLNEIQIPSKKTEIFNLELLNIEKINKKKLSNEVFKRLNLVEGDFRQDKIIKRWSDFFNKTEQNKFIIAKLNTNVSSGTYIRSLIPYIAQKIDTIGIAFTIKRTAVGNYNINDSNNYIKNFE